MRKDDKEALDTHERQQDDDPDDAFDESYNANSRETSEERSARKDRGVSEDREDGEIDGYKQDEECSGDEKYNAGTASPLAVFVHTRDIKEHAEGVPKDTAESVEILQCHVRPGCTRTLTMRTDVNVDGDRFHVVEKTSTSDGAFDYSSAKYRDIQLAIDHVRNTKPKNNVKRGSAAGCVKNKRKYNDIELHGELPLVGNASRKVDTR